MMMTRSDSRRGLSELPADIVLEVLLRLPIKSLMQYKCVCKDWYGLIGSRGFADMHFRLESNKERLLIRNYIPEEDLSTFILFEDETCTEYTEPEILRIPETADAAMGPVNGVFCLLGESRRLALVNPALRQFKPIVTLELQHPPHLVSVDNVLGFGADPRSGDFKVVSIRYFWNRIMDGLHHPPVVHVYSSGSNMWKHVPDVSVLKSTYTPYRSLVNTYLNGVYYWLTECHKTSVAALLAFNMTTDTFREILVPRFVKVRIGHLTLYKDEICLLSYDLEKIAKCDIWVMKNDGSWIKSVTVGPFQDISWPLSFWKGDELFLETEDSLLALYNVRTNTSRIIEVRAQENTSFLSWIFSYKESIVSIKGEGDHCVLWDHSSAYIQYFLQL